MGKILRLEGMRFGLLTVSEFKYVKNDCAYWLCKCDCGNEKIVSSKHLRNGHTQSCGCKRKKHGYRNTRLYHIWCRMNDRCYRENHKSYRDYGGRGITICDEWKDFKCFQEWSMANGYTDELTIDRIDVNGNYEPTNCRWATRKEQALNKRNNHGVSYKGETKTLAEWEKITGIKQHTIAKRLRNGWSIERALTEKVHSEYVKTTSE